LVVTTDVRGLAILPIEAIMANFFRSKSSSKSKSELESKIWLVQHRSLQTEAILPPMSFYFFSARIIFHQDCFLLFLPPARGLPHENLFNGKRISFGAIHPCRVGGRSGGKNLNRFRPDLPYPIKASIASGEQSNSLALIAFSHFSPSSSPP
jgi:hypothetical protein